MFLINEDFQQYATEILIGLLTGHFPGNLNHLARPLIFLWHKFQNRTPPWGITDTGFL